MKKRLLIDIGNSSTKLCWADGRELGEQILIPAGEERAYLEQRGEVLSALGEHSASSQKNRILISSVSKRVEEMMPIFESTGAEVKILKGTDRLPFKIGYETKETLGPDRVAAIAGAISQYGKKNMLVVDMGTAITLDYYDAERNIFKGGNISPGVKLRFKALSDYTSKLPLVEVKSDYKCKKIALGKNTERAILEGVLQGVRLEIEGYRRELEEKEKKKILLVLTGGDSKYFHSSTKNCTFAPENLVLKGLAYIDGWMTGEA